MPTKLSLLGLPNEITHNIFRMAMGNRAVHVKRLLPSSATISGWQASLCIAVPPCITVESHSESEEDDSLLLGFGPSDISFGKDHSQCLERVTPGLTTLHEKAYFDFSLKQLREILHVCRKIYEVAEFVIWTTWCFSFDNPYSYEYFLAGRNDLQRQRLKKLRFSIDLEDWNAGGWSCKLFSNTTNEFCALRAVHIFVRVYPTSTAQSALRAVDKSLKDLRQSLLKFQAIPLDTFTLDALAYPCIGNNDIESHSATEATEQKLAEFVHTMADVFKT